MPTIDAQQRLAAGATACAAAVALVLTVRRYGVTANGLGWCAVQLLLAVVAAWDVATRRIPNALLLPASLAAVGARSVWVPSALLETLVAGAAAFAVFLALAAILRGGIGMGDVKLAGLLGLLLGRSATSALLAGCLAGGVAAILLVVTGSAGRKSMFAYGPYLALGGALGVVYGHPPALF